MQKSSQLQSILNVIIFAIVITAQAQYTPVVEPSRQGIVKIIQDQTVLARSYKEVNIFTIEYLNQQQPELKGYASFSFEDVNGMATLFYQRILNGFEETNPLPLVFNTPKGSIRFEYAFNKPGDITHVRLAQYDQQQQLQAYSVLFDRKHLKQLFGI
ncbi:hypothetical protein [Leeuwenhoekiella palythoae]|uniref:hypothetical protein n=1 Tax=Leeuwenhoekiella palythoae TaxID=573501 RepID=UPI0035113E51